MFFDLQLLTPSLSFPPCMRKLDASGGISQLNLEVTLKVAVSSCAAEVLLCGCKISYQSSKKLHENSLGKVWFS